MEFDFIQGCIDTVLPLSYILDSVVHSSNIQILVYHQILDLLVHAIVIH